MFRAKKIFLVLLALSLVFAIASCGGTKGCDTCVDGDGDGICDVCKKAMPEEEVADVPLVEDGYPTFQVVLAKNTSSTVRQAINTTLKAKIKETYDVAIDSFTEESNNDEEIK